MGVAPSGGSPGVAELGPGGDIISALNNLDSGKTLNIASGIYSVLDGNRPTSFATLTNAPLKLINKTNVWIEGHGNAIIFVPNNGGALVYMGCSNLTFSGVTFRGTQTNGTTYDTTGVAIYGLVAGYWTNNNINFLNCRFETVNAFGLLSGGFATGVEAITHNLRIVGGSFYKCGFTNWTGGPNNPDGGGAATHGSTDMDGVLFDRCARGMEPYSDGGQAEANVTLRRCAFQSSWARDITLFSVTPIIGMTIDSCLFSHDAAAHITSAPVIDVTSIRGLRVINCTATNLANSATFIQSVPVTSVSDVCIQNNYISGANVGMVLRSQRGLIVTGNTVEDIVGRACSVNGSEILVANNVFRNCGTDGGANSSVVQGGLFSLATTNMMVKDNIFLRTSGTAPPAFIKFDAACQNSVLGPNVFADYVGGTVLIDDNGVNTKRVDASQLKQRTVLGAGNGNTNYTLLATDALSFLGSSNINISAVMGYETNAVRYWSAYITNLSAINWGIGFSSVTNRWRYINRHTGGTNAPNVFTNGTRLRLVGESNGTNTVATWDMQAYP